MNSCPVRGCFSPGEAVRVVGRDGSTVSNAGYNPKTNTVNLSFLTPLPEYVQSFDVDIEHRCRNGHAFVVVERIDLRG